MPVLHIFCCTDRFDSVDELRAFVEETYDEDGNAEESLFGAEVALDDYEPMCIEYICAPRPSALSELLGTCSYSEQWLADVPTRRAREVVCVFAPNVVLNPRGSSLDYLGAFTYET